MTEIERYLQKTVYLTQMLDRDILERLIQELRLLKSRGGRLFFIGNGGGAAHASHAAADFRKITGIESYAWGDNTADLTAWSNDAGWDLSVINWLHDSQYTVDDGLFIFSVGGLSERTSVNLLKAVQYVDGPIYGVTGKPGLLANYATVQLVLDANTAQTEGLQAVVWHLLVSCL